MNISPTLPQTADDTPRSRRSSLRRASFTTPSETKGGDGQFYLQKYLVQYVENCLLKTEVNNNFKILDFLDRGSTGQVLSAKHFKNPNTGPIVIKVTTKFQDFIEEEKTQTRIYRAAFKGEDWGQEECPIPEMIDNGVFFQLSSSQKKQQKEKFSLKSIASGGRIDLDQLRGIGKINPFIVMPRYEITLAQFFEKKNNELSIGSILDLGRRIIKLLRIVHRAGFVYNDLKPENIMMDLKPKRQQRGLIRRMSTSKSLGGQSSGRKSSRSTKSQNYLEGVSIYLVDFGSCTPYKDLTNNRVYSQGEVDFFPGNILFASLDLLDFERSARKDDMISLCYLLIYLLNKGEFLQQREESEVSLEAMDEMEQIAWAKNKKKSFTTRSLCEGRAWFLKPFVEKVFDIAFLAKPPYDELIEILEHESKCFGRREVGNSSKFGDGSADQLRHRQSLRGFVNLQFVKMDKKEKEPDWMTIQRFVDQNPLPSRPRPILADDEAKPEKDGKQRRSSMKEPPSIKFKIGVSQAKEEPDEEVKPEEEAAPVKKENASCGISFFKILFCTSPTSSKASQN